MVKKILIIDDSALMRSVISDIINSDEELEVADDVESGFEAIKLLESREYDCILLDSVMPKMRGADFLGRISDMNLNSMVVVLSDINDDDNVETLKCLEAGAFDFIKIPRMFQDMKRADFKDTVINILHSAIEAGKKGISTAYGRAVSQKAQENSIHVKPVRNCIKSVSQSGGSMKSKLIAIACSTGGPKALQDVVPYIPGNIDAPILIVQHMPKVFTCSLAERLDSLSELTVREASEGDALEKGVVYIAKGGYHMAIEEHGRGKHFIKILDGPPRAGLKPCADVMYESLVHSGYEQITCVVMTGMGSDGTKGIRQLKTKKNVYVIAQNEATSTVYGMPKAIHDAGLTDEVVPLRKISEAVIRITGVR